MQTALIWLHVVGNIIWIGSIISVGLVLLSNKGEPKVRGAIALELYRRVAVPAFIVSIVCGGARLGLDINYYLVEHHWMHGKLVVALGVIGLHHVIGARAKRMAAGTVQDTGPTGTLVPVLAVLAILATFFAVFKIPN
jgi:protoporphyrinogen IX oxidase